MQSIAPASFSKAYEVIPQIWRTEIYTVLQIIHHNAEENSGHLKHNCLPEKSPRNHNVAHK